MLKEKAKEKKVEVVAFNKVWLKNKGLEKMGDKTLRSLEELNTQQARTFTNLDYKIIFAENLKKFTIVYFKRIVNNKPMEADYQVEIFFTKFMKLYEEFLYARQEYPKGIGSQMISFLETNKSSEFILEPNLTNFSEWNKVRRRLDLFLLFGEEELLLNRSGDSSPSRRIFTFPKFSTIEKYVEAICHLYLCSIKFEKLLTEYHDKKSKHRSEIYSSQVKSCETMADQGEAFYRATWYGAKSFQRKLRPLQGALHNLRDDMAATSTIWQHGPLYSKISEFESAYGDLEHVGGIRAKFKYC